MTQTSSPVSLRISPPSVPPTPPPPPQPPPSAEAPLVELLEQDITKLDSAELEAFAARLSRMTNAVALRSAVRGKKAKAEATAGEDAGETADKLDSYLDDLFK